MTITIKSADAMKRFGERIGQLLKGGECIELIGDVGSGKTTLMKGIAVGLGITQTVQSPTFTISRGYDARDNLHLMHYDFYRLSDPGIMIDEIDEALADSSNVVAIEWGEVVKSVLPADHLVITFASPTEDERVLELNAQGPTAQRIVEGLV